MRHMAATARNSTFNVTMLGILKRPFEEWLASRNLVAVEVPGEDPNHLIVVPRHLPAEVPGE